MSVLKPTVDIICGQKSHFQYIFGKICCFFFFNSLQYLENELVSVLKPIVDIICGQIFFQHILTKIFESIFYKISLQCLEIEPVSVFKPIGNIIYRQKLLFCTIEHNQVFQYAHYKCDIFHFLVVSRPLQGSSFTPLRYPGCV